MAEHLYVVKRNGERVPVSFDQILQRIRMLSEGVEHVNPDLVAQKVCNQLQDGMSTSQLDEFAAETCAMMQARFHPNYGTLAARILINNHHKNTPATLLDCVEQLYHGAVQLVSDEYHDLVCNHANTYQSMIDYSRDNMFDYFGFKTLEKGYLLRRDGHITERPQHMWMRVAIQLHRNDYKHVKETYDALSQGYFIHATPTLFNSGGMKPQLSSCFLLTMNDDSIKGIYKTLGDCAQISKWAGGIGLSVHNIRARGSRIKGTNGESTGIVPMLKVFNDTAKYVNQGGKRNGSFAIYLEPWHADIEDFLKLKLNQGAEEDRARDLFYGLWIPDLFMKRMEAKQDWTLMCPAECPGLADCHSEEFEKLYESYERAGNGRKTIPAQKLWQMILDAQIQTGTPYLCYKDAANSKSNQQNLGTIKSSNLCVAPETLVLTDKGYFPIKELVGRTVKVWNGNEWSETTVQKTGQNQKLITVNFSNGAALTCTPYHKFLIHENYEDQRSIKDSVRVDAQDLKVGMKLKKFNAPIVDTLNDNFPYAYTHGFFCGDGTYSGGNPICSLYGGKKDLIEYLEIRSTSGKEDACGRINTTLPKDMLPKFTVPLKASVNTKLRWLEGLSDADGSIARNGTNESLQIASIEFKFLDEIRMMLLTLGVHSKVTKAFDARLTMLPDGRGGYKEFECKPLWRLLVSSSALYKLSNLGFTPKRLKFDIRQPQRNAEQFVKVEGIIDTGRYDDTYCFNEPVNHAGVFNGVLTGNCTEIMEFTSPDETAVCNLGSLALPKFVETEYVTHLDGITIATPRFNFEKLREYTQILTRNLDIVIDKNYYPTTECRNSNMRHRPIGIGIQGLADVFALMRLPWTSEGAAKLNREIFENIYHAAMTMSVERTCEVGTFDHATHEVSGISYSSFAGSPLSQGKMQFDLWNETPKHTPYLDWDMLRNKLKHYGARNSLLVAPMPTASTSQILGNNECFEPFTSNLYARRVLAGDFMVINKYLVNDLTKLGLWTSDTRTQIISDNGSIQNIPEIPADIRELYKTAWEIPQKTLINMARDRAPFICQSQSLNLFLAEPTYAKISSMHVYAWKQGLKTGCYYLRTKAVSSAQKFTIEPTKKPSVTESDCLMCSA
jgi:ribonucleoside-diphosphate reductase alpha chain